MATNQSGLFPCPRCKNSRTNIEADCSTCGWSPNPSNAVQRQTNWESSPPQTTPVNFLASGIWGWLTFTAGLALILGGAMFFVVLHFVVEESAAFAGLVQVGLGLLVAIAGIGIVYSQPFAKWLLSASVLGVVVNVVYFLFVILRLK